MPTGRYDPITPAGEYEQLDKLMSGLAAQRGRRGVAARLLAGAALLVIVAAIVWVAVLAFR
jgi:hypothetical protein